MKPRKRGCVVGSGRISKFFPDEKINQGGYVVSGEETAHHKAELQRLFDRKDKKK